MNIKNLSFMLLIACFFASACGGDECTVLSEVVPGEWQLSTGDVEFKSDGTLVDTEDVLIGFESNGNVADVKTWSLSGDTLTLRAEIDPSVGSGFAETSPIVTEFECDKMVLDLQILSATLTRK